MSDDLKVGSISIDPVVADPVISDPIDTTVTVSQADVVAQIDTTAWKTLDVSQKTSIVTTIVNDQLDSMVAEKTHSDALQAIDDEAVGAYKALEEEYRLKRIELEKVYADKKAQVI